MARGQVTIEFILILVIMLTVLATMSIPMAKDVADEAIETGTAVSLAASVQRIAQSADEVSYAGCGSFKNVTVYVEPDALSQPSIYFNDTRVWGEYYDMAGDRVSTQQLAYADYTKLTAHCNAEGHVFTVKVEKDCSNQRSKPVQVKDGVEAEQDKAYIGGVCV